MLGYILLFLLVVAVLRKLDNSRRFNHIFNNDDSYLDSQTNIYILFTNLFMLLFV